MSIGARMALALPSSLSPSRLSSFTSCGLQFRFSAIDRLPEPPTVAATRGTLVHAVLERLYTLSRRGPIRIFSYGPCTSTIDAQPWLRRVGVADARIHALAEFRGGPEDAECEDVDGSGRSGRTRRTLSERGAR